MALATCAAFPELDGDDQLLRRALADAGIAAAPVVWDDPAVDWDSFALTVVRDTWDYVDRRDEYLRWARRVPRLHNDAAVLDWNTDKRYLRTLAHRGVPVVPTTWYEPGAEPNIVLPGGDVVVKPAVSAGSRRTERYAASHHAAARGHIERLLTEGRTVMVQPYIESVDGDGETALVYIDGVYSHAARKAAILVRSNAAGDGLFAEEDITEHQATPAERRLGEAVLDALDWPRESLLYARIDMVSGTDGAPLVLEVELTEPSLFFRQSAQAASRLAAAVTRRL